jgi:hypothetical protein
VTIPTTSRALRAAILGFALVATACGSSPAQRPEAKPELPRPKADCTVEAPPPAQAPPLTRADIAQTMNDVQEQARQCFARYRVPGIVLVKVAVEPSGKVKDVVVFGKFKDTESGACVQQLASAGCFPPSPGTVFDYIIALR